jgi:undecaprenyl-diphosphatase
MFDEQVGAYSAMLFQIVPLFSAYGIVMTIDAPFMFFWLLSLLLLQKAVTEPASRHWVLLGVSVGLGLLAKYTMALFYITTLLFLLTSKDHRRLLLKAGPYIGVLISLLLFSPVIVWNIGHDWVTLKHTAVYVKLAEGLTVSPISSLDFIGSQLGVVSPILFILLLHSLIRERGKGLLFWSSIPVILFFLAKSIQGKVQANWAMTGYLAGLIAFSAVYLKDFAKAGAAKKVLVTTALALSLFVCAVSYYPSLVNLPPELDPTARLRGWKSLGAEVSKIQRELTAPVFIFSDRYQISSELAFYVEGQPVTFCVNLGRRMNQYDIWPGPDGLLHYNAIFVKIGDVPMPAPVRKAFERYEKRLFTVYDKGRKKLRDYSIFTCYDFKGIKERRAERF